MRYSNGGICLTGSLLHRFTGKLNPFTGRTWVSESNNSIRVTYDTTTCCVSLQVRHRAVLSQGNLFHREIKHKYINVYAEVVYVCMYKLYFPTVKT